MRGYGEVGEWSGWVGWMDGWITVARIVGVRKCDVKGR